MVGIVWQANTVDTQGNVIPAANVEVREQITGVLVPLFADYDLLVPLGNPTISDGFGFVRLFVGAAGLYQITASKGGFNRQWTYVLFSRPIENNVQSITTPPLLVAGNNNDWDAGLADMAVSRVRARGDAAGSILTGMAGGTDGRRIVLTNIIADPITILSESGLSVAANRFAMNGDLFWPQNTSHEFLWDSAISRWSKLGN